MKEVKNNQLMPKFSFVIAIFERSNELKELLESMTIQTSKNFEIIVVDDGSKTDLSQITHFFRDNLNIKYYYKSNEGPSIARNYGAEFAVGEYLLFVDSDCILVKNYIENIEKEIEAKKIDFFGGPDDAKEDFSEMQKAVSYAMTGFFTTGGIRGGRENKNYQPRSFNMGITKQLFLEIGGFKNIKIGEDVDLSLRVFDKKRQAKLISGAKVYHKRRINIISFARRIYSFGKMRPILMKWHPKSNRWVFYFPSLFLLGSVFLFLLSFYSIWVFFPLLFWIMAVGLESTMKYKNFMVSFLSIFTSIVQLYAYGFGFIMGFIEKPKNPL
jgi:glycosyltransferase involved in cell wall biosynthesis